MAPSGTSIEWSAFMNALVRRLTSSSFSAPKIGGGGGLYLLEKVLGDLRGTHCRGGFVPEAGATGVAGGSAVESARTVRW